MVCNYGLRLAICLSFSLYAFHGPETTLNHDHSHCYYNDLDVLRDRDAYKRKCKGYQIHEAAADAAKASRTCLNNYPSGCNIC